jgi:hypothetical protein
MELFVIIHKAPPGGPIFLDILQLPYYHPALLQHLIILLEFGPKNGPFFLTDISACRFWCFFAFEDNLWP